MKTNILRISIAPLVILMGIFFTGLPPQKGNNGDKGKEKGNHQNNDKGDKEDDNSDQSQKNRGNHANERYDDRDQGQKAKSDHDKGNKNKNYSQKKYEADYGRDKEDYKGKEKDDKDHGKGNKNGKYRTETIRWDRDENVIWGFDNYKTRKHRKDYKKVTVCHNTGNNEYPVTINISENALKAHLNHGDQVGNCNVNYSDRWPANYIRTRENVYNSYQNTWETMSYSEALLTYAAQRLLGIKSTFQTQRPSLTSQEVQRREAIILELQNNVNSLENQLAVSRQRTDGINININL